jgi:hypothetical protein
MASLINIKISVQIKQKEGEEREKVFFEKNVRGEEKRKKNSGFIWD